MDWKKIGTALLFPHLAVFLLLLPAAACFLGYAMLFWEDTAPLRIFSYLLAFYALTTFCARIPRMIRRIVRIKNENKYAQLWLNNPRLRINVTLTGSVVWNAAYAALQLGLGIFHRSLWFYALAGYYFLLALMRFFLVCYSVRHRPGEKLHEELRRYRACGWVFLLMNAALSTMVFFMIYENRLVRHHEITTITMAAYTFTSLTMAILNVIKYRKLGSPVFSASKAISLASACVSMLTLEGTMLATFRSESMTAQTQRIFLSLSGGAVSLFIVAMAISMIVKANRTIKTLEIPYAES